MVQVAGVPLFKQLVAGYQQPTLPIVLLKQVYYIDINKLLNNTQRMHMSNSSNRIQQPRQVRHMKDINLESISLGRQQIPTSLFQKGGATLIAAWKRIWKHRCGGSTNTQTMHHGLSLLRRIFRVRIPCLFNSRQMWLKVQTQSLFTRLNSLNRYVYNLITINPNLLRFSLICVLMAIKVYSYILWQWSLIFLNKCVSPCI